MSNDSTDWLDDESMSPDETLRRFNALQPASVSGPRNEHRPFRVDTASPVTIWNSRVEQPRPTYSGTTLS